MFFILLKLQSKKKQIHVSSVVILVALKLAELCRQDVISLKMAVIRISI